MFVYAHPDCRMNQGDSYIFAQIKLHSTCVVICNNESALVVCTCGLWLKKKKILVFKEILHIATVDELHLIT